MVSLSTANNAAAAAAAVDVVDAVDDAVDAAAADDDDAALAAQVSSPRHAKGRAADLLVHIEHFQVGGLDALAAGLLDVGHRHPSRPTGSERQGRLRSGALAAEPCNIAHRASQLLEHSNTHHALPARASRSHACRLLERHVDIAAAAAAAARLRVEAGTMVLSWQRLPTNQRLVDGEHCALSWRRSHPAILLGRDRLAFAGRWNQRGMQPHWRMAAHSECCRARVQRLQPLSRSDRAHQ